MSLNSQYSADEIVEDGDVLVVRSSESSVQHVKLHTSLLMKFIRMATTPSASKGDVKPMSFCSLLRAGRK